MRFLLTITMPNEQANAAIKNGSLPKTIQSILAEQKPEAAYFTEMNGLRTAVIVLNMDDVSQMPAVAEPWFLALNARVEFHPAMAPGDLAKAGPAIKQAAKKYR